MILLGEVSQHAVTRSLLRVVAFSLALVVLYLVLIGLRVGQQIDAGSFGAFSVINGLDWPLTGVYRIAATIILGLAAVVCGILALLQHRVADTARAALIVVLSTALCEGIKFVVPRPDLGGYGYAANTFPSGHVAFALSAALAIALTAPQRVRGILTGLAVVATIWMAWASVASYAHRPSDVIGGALVVGVVASGVFWGRRSVLDGMPVLTMILLCCLAWASMLVIVGVVLTSVVSVVGQLIESAGWAMACAAAVVAVAALVPERSTPRHP